MLMAHKNDGQLPETFPETDDKQRRAASSCNGAGSWPKSPADSSGRQNQDAPGTVSRCGLIPSPGQHRLFRPSASPFTFPLSCPIPRIVTDYLTFGLGLIYLQ